jgi:transposase
MNAEQLTKLAALSKAYPKTGRAFRIVQALDLFYASKDDKEAAKQFKQLYSWMRRSRLAPMKDAAETLMNHEREILHYFHDRLTNAVCEGINSMI